MAAGLVGEFPPAIGTLAQSGAFRRERRCRLRVLLATGTSSGPWTKAVLPSGPSMRSHSPVLPVTRTSSPASSSPTLAWSVPRPLRTLVRVRARIIRSAGTIAGSGLLTSNLRWAAAPGTVPLTAAMTGLPIAGHRQRFAELQCPGSEGVAEGPFDGRHKVHRHRGGGRIPGDGEDAVVGEHYRLRELDRAVVQRGYESPASSLSWRLNSLATKGACLPK